MGLKMSLLFNSLKTLVPLNIPFNILFCFPTLAIPLGSQPKITSTSTLQQKDLVTTPDQLNATPEAPLIITQRTGQNIFIDTKVPVSNFFWAMVPLLSVTGSLQTMVNMSYNTDSPAVLISSFGVYGLDGLLRLVETSITDGLDPDRSQNNNDKIQMRFKLAFQPPEPDPPMGSVGSASPSAMNEINGFIP
jgi:hypothetical protein